MNDHVSQNNTHLPVYNIKAVSRLTGLLPVTLRAWERRYGLPAPGRGDQGYRLYSDYDVRTLRWLKTQLSAGMNIGRAIEYLHELRASGQDPALEVEQPAKMEQPVSVDHLANLLFNSLTHFDETGAVETMRRAFALYSVDQVLTDVVQPALVEIGEAWHNGELSIAVEHYATQFCVQHLMSVMSASAPPTRQGTIVAACAPGEMHQIGLLMLVVMLRWHSWDVKYLGPDLKLEELHQSLDPLHPRMLLISSTRRETALPMLNLSNWFDQFPNPKPHVVLGGHGFHSLALPEHPKITYLNQSPTEILKSIEEIMKKQDLPEEAKRNEARHGK